METKGTISIEGFNLGFSMEGEGILERTQSDAGRTRDVFQASRLLDQGRIRVMNQIPVGVQKILHAYFEWFERELPNLLEAFHVYGSISIGAFQEGASDIDFIAVIKRKWTEEESIRIKKLHKSIHRAFPSASLDGFYITKESMEGLKQKAQPCFSFRDGNYQGEEVFHQHSIDAYQLVTYGITVKGSDPRTYGLSIDWELLHQFLRGNLDSYWVNWVRRCERFPSLHFVGMYMSPKMIEWGVLGISRLFYSFREKDIASKLGAGEYACSHAPEKWNTILKEAMRVRRGESTSYYTSPITRRNDALGYMKEMIQICKN
ncbi:DUF4111 domain-containing protein [Brevibacillus invocatus]|uniref:DUF4111 domain-containing protein n=2 Tax=Brevibacillus invocatus TaxID=173959 RepID=A0A3M8BS50_9BACL|nr:aminoglycoside adenylyltransferase domain-containing protein [Brevibacillus invocatus]RNB66252.1 DUF4111 domain-containing protein [Brevibacillus invocatus]